MASTPRQATILQEKRLRFEFSTRDWSLALKWDDCKAHAAFIRGRSDTRAVDFLAESPTQLVLIEVKDFRKHRIENKHRLGDEGLPVELATKARDTLAGLVWGAGRDLPEAPERHRALRALFRDRRPLVVLWLEDDALDEPQADALGAKTKELLRPWLTANVIVTNRRLGSLKGLRVSAAK